VVDDDEEHREPAQALNVGAMMHRGGQLHRAEPTRDGGHAGTAARRRPRVA
jgi:hypothetical protein